jgi:hypothetical protein
MPPARLNTFSMAVPLEPRNNQRGGQDHLQQLLKLWIHHRHARWHASGAIQSAAFRIPDARCRQQRSVEPTSQGGTREAIFVMKRHARTDRA